MTHLTNKNPFKINDLPFWQAVWQVLASVLARKKLIKSRRCHKWHAWQGKNGRAWILASRVEKQGGKERNWNVNEPYGNVNWKVEKSAKRRDKRQFTHSNTT